VSSGDLFAGLLSEIGGFFAPLPDKPDETAETVLRALWQLAAGTPVSVTRARTLPLPDLDPAQTGRLRELIEKKRSGVPLAHLTGRQEFLGLELLASPGAMIPRRETEILGRAALERLQARSAVAESVTVLDVCTGSGNLALAYAFHEPKARVFASDLSPDAVEVARRNAAFTGLASRVEFRVGDLFAPFEDADLAGRCDLVSCNPPYISTAKVAQMPAEISAHEPRLPFDGGVFGLTIISRLVKEAEKFLKPGGVLCFEVGAGQGPALGQRLQRLAWATSVEPQMDAAGTVRAFVMTRAS
jgi:release factor glutamine methyltransferase